MSSEGEVVLRQLSDEQLTAEFLGLHNSGKRGSRAYQALEMEMRARNLLRHEGRFSSSYSGSRGSRYDAQPLLFAGYSSNR